MERRPVVVAVGWSEVAVDDLRQGLRSRIRLSGRLKARLGSPTYDSFIQLRDENTNVT